MTQNRLQEFSASNKISTLKNVSMPSLNLLLRFQRLLVAKIFSKDQTYLQVAESLLKKYLYQLTSHVSDTINYAYEVAVNSSKNFLYVLEILKGDIIGKTIY